MGSRRGHNEGSIYQRASDGLWVGSINLGYGPDGKRKRKPIYGKTRKEVAEKMKRMLRDQQLGVVIATRKQSFGSFLYQWLEEWVKPSVKPATYANYEVYVRVHTAPALGHIRLSELTAQDLQAFYNYKLTQGLSARTVAHCHATIRRALNIAIKWDLIPRNPATLVTAPKCQRHEITPFSPEQARTFLHAVKGHRLEALYSVAMALGLRRGEALALQWEDVDLPAGTLTVRATLQRLGGELVRSDTKTAGSRRKLMLPDVCITALRAHKLRQKEDALLAGPRWQGPRLHGREVGYVFTSTVGTPLEPRNLNRHFSQVLKKEGLPPIRFHDLRHTAATLLLIQGVSPRLIMDLLGHSKIAVTMDVYAHVLPSLQREAAQAMHLLLTAEV